MASKFDCRTHPIFQGQNNTNSLNLGLSTHCTMKCPKCSIAVPREKEQGTARHAMIADIVRDAKWMQGLRRVHLTGGEPCVNPMFRYIAEHVRKWFNCAYVTIETNGSYYTKYRDVFQTFDLVFITHYEANAVYEGSPDNTEIIEQADKDLGDRLIREPAVRHTTEHGLLQLGAVPCSKFYEPGLPAGWYNSLLYSCCVSVGINPNLGIPVTEDWRERIKDLPMGCGHCCFRGS
jgi:hypothetical protein